MKNLPQPVEYTAGHFCALVHAHNWPPEFVSRWPSRAVKVMPQNHRKNGGFDRHPVGLIGAIPYIIRGRVGDM